MIIKKKIQKPAEVIEEKPAVIESENKSMKIKSTYLTWIILILNSVRNAAEEIEEGDLEELMTVILSQEQERKLKL